MVLETSITQLAEAIEEQRTCEGIAGLAFVEAGMGARPKVKPV